MQKVCEYCSNEYLTRNPNQRFCSTSCSSEYILNQKSNKKRANFTLFERDDFKCVYCGSSSIEHGALLLADHVIPISEGGDNTVYNLVTCCYECNLLKGDKFLSPEVYKRIVDRNTLRNKGISQASALFVESVFSRLRSEDIKKYHENKE